MSRRHLESALVAGALLESGLQPCFRFTRVRFARSLNPPDYEPSFFDVDEPFFPDTQLQRCRDLHTSTPLSTTHGLVVTPHSSLKSGSLLNENSSEANTAYHAAPLSEDDFGIHSIQFSSDGRQIVAGAANTSLRMIDVVEGRSKLVVRPSRWTLGMPITSLRFMPPNLYWVIGCTPHGDIFAFHPDHEGFQTIIKEKQETYCLDISPDGLELATGGNDRQIRIYELHPETVTGFEKSKYPLDGQNTLNTISSIGCERKRLEYPSCNEPTPWLRHPLFPGGRPDQLVDRSCKPYLVNACYSCPALPFSTCAYPEPAGYTDELQSGRRIPKIPAYLPTSPGDNITLGHSMRIMALRYHPSLSNILVSASWDNTLKIWDTRLRSGPVCQIYGPHVSSPDGLDIDDNYILTASWRANNSLELWDLRKISAKRPPNEDKEGGLAVQMPIDSATRDKPAERIPVCGDPIWESAPAKVLGEYLYAAKLLPSRAIACAGSGFKEVRVVHRDTLLPIVRINTGSFVHTMDTILEGRYIVAGCASGSICLIGLA